MQCMVYYIPNIYLYRYYCFLIITYALFLLINYVTYFSCICVCSYRNKNIFNLELKDFEIYFLHVVCDIKFSTD